MAGGVSVSIRMQSGPRGRHDRAGRADYRPPVALGLFIVASFAGCMA